MPPQVLYLPDGQTFTVTPVFAGLGFRSHELNTHPSAFPIGWTVVLNTEEDGRDEEERARSPDGNSNNKTNAVDGEIGSNGDGGGSNTKAKRPIHSFVKPTLQNDNLFISSITNPPTTEFKPAASPTRQIAMMLWITLYWYFHQPAPSAQLPQSEASRLTPAVARPCGEWRINIRRDGVLRSRNLIPKLERMGLLASDDTSVGLSMDDGGDAWSQMFVSKRMFWQLPGRLFLFSLQPNRGLPSSVGGTPSDSRPGSPTVAESPTSFRHSHTHSYSTSMTSHSPHSSMGRFDSDLPGGPMPTSVGAVVPSFPISPFYSSSHLPTYYPPPPLQYVFTNNIRHPLRPKPPRMGEVFYSRYVPSVGQYLSFRVASVSPEPVPYLGPVGPTPPKHTHLAKLSDASLMETWMAKPRVKEFWGDYSPDFLANGLKMKNSYPVIGLWDGIPFGYFEIYWVKEDVLGQQLGSESGEWDRGLHVLIGEEWARGRVPIWLTGLVHYCLTSEYRTMNICLEPRVDNAR